MAYYHTTYYRPAGTHVRIIPVLHHRYLSHHQYTPGADHAPSRGPQAFCRSPLTSATLRGIPEDEVCMASGLFNLHCTLARTVGVALTATLMDYREDVHTLLLSERQALYPLRTQVATETIRGVLV
jgi:hypothetical protein